MKGLRIFLECVCGGQIVPSILYAGEDYDLYIEGICQGCTDHRTISIDYERLWEMSGVFKPIGKPLHPPMAQLPAPVFNHVDLSFLKDLHIVDEVP